MRALLFALAASLGVGMADAQHADDARPLKVCLVSGSAEYESERTLPAFARFVEEHYPAECTVVQAEGEEALPGLEALNDCDVALFFTRRLEIDGEPLQRIKDYATSGRPVVGVRTASHGFQHWLEMDAAVFGGHYHGHYKNELTTEIALAREPADHPTIRHFEPYTSNASLYKVAPLADDCRVLLVGTSPEGQEPLAWTREVNGGRVFYTSLGHPDDFAQDGFRRLLADALFWAAGRAPDAR